MGLTKPTNNQLTEQISGEKEEEEIIGQPTTRRE